MQSAPADSLRVIEVYSIVGGGGVVEANREVICSRLEYDRSANIIRVYGKDREPAQIYQEATTDDPYGIWRGPELIWDRDSGQIEARQTTIITPGR